MVHSQWPRPPLGLERCGTKWNYPECLSQTSINTSAKKPKDPFGPGPIPVLRPRFASGPLPRAMCTSGYNPPPQVMLRISSFYGIFYRIFYGIPRQNSEKRNPVKLLGEDLLQVEFSKMFFVSFVFDLAKFLKWKTFFRPEGDT